VGSHAVALLFLEFALVLVYSLVSDFLHVAAMVAYIRILKGEDPAVAVQIASGTDLPGYGASVDRDELILSDLPLPAI